MLERGVASPTGVRIRSNVRVPMRDGVGLSTDLFLPGGNGRFPTILLRTPYDNSLPAYVTRARALADAGYAVALQDVRGRFDSEGLYTPFRNEADDGFDTHEWLGAQPWSSGRIGMFGGSYDGWTQWSAATRASRHLSAIVPRVMATSLHRGLVHPGGALNLGVLLTWGLRTSGHSRQRVDDLDWVEAFRTLPLSETADAAAQDVPHWREWLEHEGADDWWAPVDLDAAFGNVRVPALVMGGWYDLYASDTFTSFAGLRRMGHDGARQSRLIVGPWPHALSTSSRTGGVDFGARSMEDLDALEERWFDRWLRDGSSGADEGRPRAEGGPPIRLFVMGRNAWRDVADWPPADAEPQRWYLHSGGSASTLRGDGGLSTAAPADEPADRFTYDPENPVQTQGGCNCCQPEIIPWGPYDQRGVEMRGDVLCFTSAPLERDLTVIGPIRVVLWAATDGPDTDWTAKLVDVRPSGFAMNLCDGVVRARWRSSEDRRVPQLLDPGSVERYEIEGMVTANTFRAGHRIRLEISSSNFPRFDRNPNTGEPLATASATRAARQTILHDVSRPSHVLLPVVTD